MNKIDALINDSVGVLHGSPISQELVFEESELRKYPVSSKKTINITSPDSVSRLENLFPVILALCEDYVTCGIGTRLLYIMGRSCFLYKEGNSFKPVFSVNHDSALWSVEDGSDDETSLISRMLDSSNDKERLQSILRDAIPSVNLPREVMKSTSLGATSNHKIAFFGMAGCLALRSIVKGKESLGYLFSSSGSKMSQYYAAFYDSAMPYSDINLNNVQLENLRKTTPTSTEARRLLFTTLEAYMDSSTSEIAKRLISGCNLQTIINYGMPTIGWAIKAQAAGKYATLNDFLKAMLCVENAPAINSIIEYILITRDDPKKKYHYISRVLSSSYYKSLGREMNSSFIIICYLICFHGSEPDERERLKRFKKPSDSRLLGKDMLYNYLKSLKTTLTLADGHEKVSIMKDSLTTDEAEKDRKARRLTEEIYKEAMTETVSSNTADDTVIESASVKDKPSTSQVDIDSVL